MDIWITTNSDIIIVISIILALYGQSYTHQKENEGSKAILFAISVDDDLS